MKWSERHLTNVDWLDLGVVMIHARFYGDRHFIPTLDWLRRLAEETAGFEVTAVIGEAAPSDGMRSVWDFVVTLSTTPDNRRVELFVVTRQQLSPQTVLGVFERLKQVPPKGVLLICVPFISPRVAELCRDKNVSYIDGVGNCRIAAPGLFIDVSGRPNRPTKLKSVVDPFSTKSSRIVRALLAHPDKGWQVQQLAQQADVSMGLASKVKNALLEEAYLEERDRLLHLRDPAKLLQDWAARYRRRVQRVRLFAMSRPTETETRLASWCRENGVAYGLTQLSAAWRCAPMVRYDKTVVYIDKKAASETHSKALFGRMDAREVDTGANCEIWFTDDPAIFTDAEEFDGVKVVSPLQLYLDLKGLAGRGEDAAREILEKKLPALLPDSRRESGQLAGGRK